MGTGNEMDALAEVPPAFIIGPDGIDIDCRQDAHSCLMAAEIGVGFVV